MMGCGTHTRLAPLLVGTETGRGAVENVNCIILDECSSPN